MFSCHHFDITLAINFLDMPVLGQFAHPLDPAMLCKINALRFFHKFWFGCGGLPPPGRCCHHPGGNSVNRRPLNGTTDHPLLSLMIRAHRCSLIQLCWSRFPLWLRYLSKVLIGIGHFSEPLCLIRSPDRSPVHSFLLPRSEPLVD